MDPGGLAALRLLGRRGSARQAALYGPSGLAVDGRGTLFIADTQNHRIRKVEPTGIIRTVVGRDHSPGETSPPVSEPGVASVQTWIGEPEGVAAGRGGRLYFTEKDDPAIWERDPHGHLHRFPLTAGPRRIRRLPIRRSASPTPGAVPVVPAEDLITAGAVQSLAVGRGGTVYIADVGTRRVRSLSPSGRIAVVAGRGRDR